MKNLALFAALAVLTLGASAVSAKDSSSSKDAVRALTSTPAAELPAAAAKIITSTPKQSQAAVINAVMRKVARTHPVALHHVVAAVAKADPTLASVAAACAAKAMPESTLAVAKAACNSAPEMAPQILATFSRANVAAPSALATVVAESNPVFSAETLVRQASAIEITADADVITGGTVVARPIGLPPGSIGQNLKGDVVTTAPLPIGPGRPGFDPDRYAAAGN